MQRRFSTVAVAAVMLWAQPAAAQTAPASPSSSSGAPTVNMLYIGVFAGAAKVDKVAAVGGAELGFRVANNLDLVIEGGWMQDLASSKKKDQADLIAAYLTTRTGQTAAADIEAPAFYGMGGLRYVFERDGAVRPYIIGQAGVARVELKPTFTLGGTAVTGGVAQYGVTLGSDLSGTSTKLAYGGGLGVVIVKGEWYVDVAARFTSIQTDGSAINAGRGTVGFGRRF